MKTTKISLSMAIFMIAASLLFTDCRKRDKTPAPEPDNEQSSASDNAVAENTSNDIISMGSQVSENTGTMTTYRGSSAEEFMLIAPCATITPGYTNGTLVATQYTVDFGTTGCTGQDGRVRTGKLFFDFSGSTGWPKRYRNPGFKMVITSSNYVVDGYAVAISGKTITNTTPITIPTGTNPGTNITWAINANISITKPNNGGTVSWTCSRTKELVNTNDPNCYQGQGSAILWTKAIVKLNGTASGTNSQSESFSSTATNLVRDFNCAPDGGKPHRHPFISGTIDYTPGTRATRHIDYGNGDCDFNATVTINGQTFTMPVP
jgi:hypothetical protein